MLAVTVFGVGLGAVLMAWDGITGGSAQRAVQDGALGAVVGGIAGVVGGFVANQLFNAVLG